LETPTGESIFAGMPEIDVVILNWNGLHFLKLFLPVLIRHTPAEQANIIIADNGSSDESLIWLADNYASRVKTIPFDKNYGFAGGYNKALEQLNSKYIVILNSDVEVSNNWLAPLLLAIESDRVAAVMPRIKSFKNKDRFEYAGAAGGFIDRWGVPFCRGRILDHVEEDSGQYDENYDVFWTTGACMMIKLDIFREVKGFDAGFFAHMEEIDLCWRIKSSGYDIKAIPSSTVFHVGGGTLPSGNHKKIFLNVRNSLLTLYKNLPRKNLISILLVRMILDGLAAFKFLLEGQPKSFSAVLRAHIAFYKGRKNYKTVRRQNRKVIHPNELSGYYPRSIVVDYYLRSKRRFSQLESKVNK